MPQYKMDMKNEENFWKPPPGNFICIINKIEGFKKEESKLGFPYFDWTFCIDQGDFAGHTFNIPTNCTKGKRWTLKMLLGALGIIANEKGEYEFDTDTFISKQIVLEISKSKSKDGTKEYTNIRNAWPPVND